MKLLCVTLNLLFFIHSVYPEVHILAKYDDEDSKTVNVPLKKRLELTCNITSTDKSSKLEVDWEKDDTPVEQIATLKPRQTKSNRDSLYKLIIDPTHEDDVGNYSCVATQNGVRFAGRITATRKIAVKVSSYVNVIEGETLRIHCLVHGNPRPEIYWTYENDTFKANYTKSTDRVFLDEDKDGHVPNAIFRINEITMFDRGNYTCVGYSDLSHDEVHSSCYVRIKDKYAALWPFLGICAEVFILCAIIFIYEKKRNKTELEESDTDQSPDQKNTPDQGKDSNLRHRQ